MNGVGERNWKQARKEGGKGKKRTATNGGSSLVIAVPLVQRGSDGRRGVADGAAGVLASLGSEVASGLNSLDGNIDDGLGGGGSGRDGGAGDGNNRKEGNQGGEKLDHFGGFLAGYEMRMKPGMRERKTEDLRGSEEDLGITRWN